MNRAQLDTNIKHPIILPKKCHVSELVTRYCHQRVGHQGRGMTINEVRASGFWVLGLSSAVSGMISRCVRCRKLRGVAQVQKMAELPEDRVNHHHLLHIVVLITLVLGIFGKAEKS